MERYFKASLGIVMLAALGMSVACKTEKKGCTGCCEEPGITKEITMPITKEKVTLNFFNAMTPVNDEYCNYDLATKEKIDGSCRPNFDSTFNDDLNSIFAIGGYDPAVFKKNGLRTYLRIHPENDTTQVWPNPGASVSNTANYMDQGVIFRGETEITPTSGDMGIIKFYASGRYTYKFLIYDSVSQILDSTITHPDNPFKGMSSADSLTLSNEDPFTYYGYLERYNKIKIEYKTANKKERLIDSVVGKFCIIRNNYDCPTNGCIGKDANDPWLK